MVFTWLVKVLMILHRVKQILCIFINILDMSTDKSYQVWYWTPEFYDNFIQTLL